MKDARHQTLLIGIDTGGTFTDLVLFYRGEIRVQKVLSTPRTPAQAVLRGLREILSTLRDSRRLAVTYGSTVATNALLERRGARVVLLTTSGFEDLLAIGRQTRSRLYDLQPREPEPLVPAARRLGIEERISCQGRVLRGLSLSSVQAAVSKIRKIKAEAVAICFLHSYANPAHERRVEREVERLGLPLSVSHKLVREYREYERLSTTVVNAYVAPLMAGDLAEVERGIGRGRLRVMQSNGGAISSGTARREAVRTILSGPAGGVVGALDIARRAGVSRVITLDMGGTSTDVSLCPGAIPYRTDWTIEGLPIKVPVIDIHTVGAGGGSIAYRDAGGSLKVGPHSAGAVPGPACYGRGNLMTVTDANLFLGRLQEEWFLGGQMVLYPQRTAAVLRRLGRQLALSMEETAYGVIQVVNANMERALRVISVERGFDPREFVLVAFGGAAGLHACELAVGLAIGRVLIPQHPGLLSARGMLGADIMKDYALTIRGRAFSWREIEALYRPLVRRAMGDMVREGVTMKGLRWERTLEMRYAGQSYEVMVPCRPNYQALFHTLHNRLYGHADPRRPTELVNIRLTVRGGGKHIASPQWKPRRGHGRLRPVARKKVFVDRAFRSTPIYLREDLAFGHAFSGPAVICEFSSTVYVPPEWRVGVDAYGNLMLRLGA